MAESMGGRLIQSPDMLWLLNMLDAQLGCVLSLEAAYTVHKTQNEIVCVRVEGTCPNRWRH